MLPIDLPPDNLLDAFRSDLDRPAAVSISITPTPYHTMNFCVTRDSERAERPHGGEPELQFFRIATSTSSETLVAMVHQSILGSASNALIEGIKLDRMSSKKGARRS